MKQSVTRKLSLTLILVAVNVAVFIRGTIVAGTLWPTRTTQFDIDYGEIGIFIAVRGEWWRLFTGGFLHSGIAHLVFNMLFLWFLGSFLESLLGSVRFFFLYFGSLLAGAFGVLLLEDAFTVTVGASGAVFGLMGGALVLRRLSGGDTNVSGLAFLLVINLLITFTVPGISIGGHLGGLVGGVMVSYGYLLVYRLSQDNYFKAISNSELGTSQAQIFKRTRRKEIILSSALAVALCGLFFLGGLWTAEISAPDSPFFIITNS